MVLSIFGIFFGILGIFTIGIVFVPLAALCALLGFVSGVINRQFSTAVLASMAGLLAGIGWTMSPTLWVATALLIAPHVQGTPARADAVTTRSAAEVLVPPPSPSDDMAAAAFQAGKRDRTAWEQFADGISGDEHEGAEWWAGQRSLKTPKSCSSGPSEAYRRGCEEARSMLGPWDVQRKANPNYRAGWNSF